jgi:hypothetical protein
VFAKEDGDTIHAKKEVVARINFDMAPRNLRYDRAALF